MPDPDRNPFSPDDPDRHAIWEMLVRRDIAAFVAQDGAAMAADIEAEGFIGLDAQRSSDPDDWRLAYSFDAYQAEWLRQARATNDRAGGIDLAAALFGATRLDHIDLHGDMAVAHKKFDGIVRFPDGGTERLDWQTLYFCRRLAGRWKIVGFTGYMPRVMPHQP